MEINIEEYIEGIQFSSGKADNDFLAGE